MNHQATPNSHSLQLTACTYSKNCMCWLCGCVWFGFLRLTHSFIPQNVVDLSLVSDGEDDDEVQITGTKVAPSQKRRRTTSPGAAELEQGAKPAAARGITIPTAAVKSAIEAAAQQLPPSPEKGIKCAVCLETIEQMASTACG